MGKLDPHDSPCQLSLSFEPGLAQRHGSLRQCMAAGVYSVGVVRVAGQIDMSPSKLCEKLSGGVGARVRDIGLEEFERYLEKTGDLQPIYYLIDRYLSSPEARQQEALSRVHSALENLPSLLAAAGLAQSAVKKSSR